VPPRAGASRFMYVTENASERLQPRLAEPQPQFCESTTSNDVAKHGTRAELERTLYMPRTVRRLPQDYDYLSRSA